MRYVLLISIYFSILFFTSISGFSQTTIPGGDVSGVWDISGSPYQVEGDITIPDTETLTIDPGVTVEFQGHYALFVMGRLLAVGTAVDTILFTVNDTTGFHNPDTTLGGWYGIKIADTPEQNDSSKIIYCKLQYGKAVAPVWWLNAGGAICIVHFSKVRISNCLITHNIAGGPVSDLPAGGGIHLAWADVVITDNTISYNRAVAGGAIQIHDSHPVFSNNLFLGNMAQEGAGISAGDLSNIEFNGDSFINNISPDHGGGIMCWNPINWSFNDVTFSGNEADWGAGLGLSGGNVVLNNCLFENNKASGIGGGIAADFCELIINNTIFSNDSSDNLSGAIHNWFSETTINHCTFSNNSALLGGGIFADFSSVEIDSSTFTGNSADAGGALRFWCSNLDVDSVLFQDNFVFNQGGAIEYTADTNEMLGIYQFSLKNTQFIENAADFRCGAFSLQQINSETSLIDLSIDNCEFSKNHGERIGALRIVGNISDISITNSRFMENSSDLWTGCMNISSGGTGTVTNCLYTFNSAGAGSAGATGSNVDANINYINCTFVGNSAVTGGGALGLRGSVTSNVINSIFWGNSPNQISLTALTDTTPCQLYLNYCNIQDGLDSIAVDTISMVHWGEGNILAQPMFEDTLNGDFSLSDISPCIGVGIDSIEVMGTWFTCPGTDLFGDPRPNPAGTMPDLGAIESPLPDTTSSIHHVEMDNKRFHLKTYPNPFTTTIEIEYILEKSSIVNIYIYNQLGERKIFVSNELQKRGKHSFHIDLSTLSTGIYYCSLKTSIGIESVKLVKMD